MTRQLDATLHAIMLGVVAAEEAIAQTTHMVPVNFEWTEKSKTDDMLLWQLDKKPPKYLQNNLFSEIYDKAA
jgi:hypothetical protein